MEKRDARKMESKHCMKILNVVRFHRDGRYGPSSVVQTAYAPASTAYRAHRWYLAARSLAVLGHAALA